MPPDYLEIHSEARALRLHIQKQTLEYAQRYITTDYVDYTEAGVAETFSSSLYEISPYPPTEVTLPVDPLDKLLGLHTPAPYDEIFILSEQERDAARKALAAQVALSKGEPASLVAMKMEEPSTLDTPRRPLSPILTARARRQTPKILHRSRAQVIGMRPTEMEEVIEKGRIHSVSEEDIVPEKIDEVKYLKVQYTMTADEVEGFRALLARVPTNKSTAYQPPAGFVDFLRATSPPPPKYIPRAMSPPLFPRSETVGTGAKRTAIGGVRESGHVPGNLAGLLDAVGAEPTVLPGDEFSLEAIAQENMKMLCGDMDFLPPSSPPPPSLQRSDLTSSDAAQPSSPPPQTPARIHPSERAFFASSPATQEMRIAKFDEVLFPKNQQRGRKLPPPKNPPKFADLVAELHHPVPIRPRIHTPPPVATILVPASPSISNDSVLGQPDTQIEEEEIDELADDISGGPSRTTSKAPSRMTSRSKAPAKTTQLLPPSQESEIDELADDDLLDAVVDRLAREARIDPFGYIMQEKLDERESLMLDLPDLPPPNIHPVASPRAPQTLSDLLCATKFKHGQEHTESPWLRRVGGLQSLQIELDWRVTMLGERVPTHEEVARADSLCEGDEKTHAKAKFREFREKVQGGSSVPGGAFGEDQEGENVAVGKGGVWDREPLILTRDERRKLYASSLRRDEIDAEASITAADEETSEGSPNVDKIQGHARNSTKASAYHEPVTAPHTQVTFVPLSFESNALYSQRLEPLRSSSGAYPADLESPTGSLNPGYYEDVEVDYDEGLAEDYGEAPVEQWVEDSGYSEGAELDLQIERQHGMEPDEDEDEAWFQFLSQVQDGSTQPVGESLVEERLVEEPFANEAAPMDPDPDAIQETFEEEPYYIEQEEHTDASLAAPNAASQVVQDTESDVPLGRPVEWKDLQPKHSARHKLASFMLNRARSGPSPPPSPPQATPIPVPAPVPAPEQDETRPTSSALQPIPAEILPLVTLIPAKLGAPPEPVRIIASMQIVQHRSLVQSLKHPTINIHLIERSSSLSPPPTTTTPSWAWQSTSPPMHGASLILDPNTALVLIPLADLPTPDAIPAVSRLLQSLMERYGWVGVILEAYSRRVKVPREDIEERREEFAVDPFTPPVKKALVALRRALALLRGGPNPESPQIELGVARSAQEAARIVRGAVELAEKAWEGAWEVWGTREWVPEDVTVEEEELAGVPGMNVFAAITVLAQVTIDELLGMGEDERREVFGPSITLGRVEALNEAVARGQERVEMLAASQEQAEDEASAVDDAQALAIQEDSGA